MTSHKKPKSVESSGSIKQKKDKPLQSFTKRFNQETTLFKKFDEKMKKYPLSQGIQPEFKFVERIRIKTPKVL